MVWSMRYCQVWHTQIRHFRTATQHVPVMHSVVLYTATLFTHVEKQSLFIVIIILPPLIMYINPIWNKVCKCHVSVWISYSPKKVNFVTCTLKLPLINLVFSLLRTIDGEIHYLLHKPV